ncbi:MAG: alpha/beta fold hydrolase [Polyangiaceae bacterium]|jgi:pimeloyl-ACP methyl ester carboxylesterase|nr:alpha/beta fold hydrolase [Polyangiaceae bacterium]
MSPSIDERLLGWAEAEGYANTWVDASDGTRLRAVVGGREGAPRVVFLHGAPQHAYGWREVLRLVRERVRFVAPDLRGYGASALAADGRYDVERLAEDVDAVLDATGEGPVVLVGHDWGGVVAWHYAMTRPARLRHLIVVNGPHPAAYARAIRRPPQLLMSWYVFAFQVPGVERLLGLGDLSFGSWLFQKAAPPGFFGDDLGMYVDAVARPGRLEAGLAYYRQAFPRSLDDLRDGTVAPPVEVPTTVVWGEADTALARSHPKALKPFVRRLRVERLPGVSHWVPEERPRAVADALFDVLEK